MKMAALAPIPKASDKMAIKANPGFFRSVRMA
jgi:hypothetical protein